MTGWIASRTVFVGEACSMLFDPHPAAEPCRRAAWVTRQAGGRSYSVIGPMWFPLLVKAVATALLVVSASAVAEALGPFWGALIASLPVSAGPAYVFLAMQHDADFVAASALGGFAANAATGLFLIVYERLAGFMPPWRSLGLATVAWLAAALALTQFDWTPVSAGLLNLVVFLGGFALSVPIRHRAPEPVGAKGRQWIDLPLRAILVATFVSLVVAVSSALGPGLTGIAAASPVTLISLLAFVRPRIGGPASALLAANALRSMLGFGLMLLFLHMTVRQWGATVSLSAALLISASWSLALLAVRKRRPL